MEDTYSVMNREVQAMVDGKACDFTVLRYYATFYGREPTVDGAFTDPCVQVWADGSITLESRGNKIFLYDDQWRGILKAIEMAMKEKKEKSQRIQDDWLEKTANSTEFHGIKVDLTRTEVIDAVTTCEIIVEGGHPVIVFNGTKHSLGRTDLMDDIATGLCAEKSPEEWRQHYLRTAESCMGARIRETDDGRFLFSIIDSLTDG